MSLLNQAKHVFTSLKSNQMYSESELAAWRQRHLSQLQQQPITPARITEGDMGGPSRDSTATPAQRSPGMPRKKGAAEKKMQENAKNVGNAALDNQRARHRGGKQENRVTPPGKRTRKGISKPSSATFSFRH
jgi:bromodomain-containing protein 9